MKYLIGLRETAEIATAVWIDSGLIKPDYVPLAFVHNKVKQSREKLLDVLSSNKIF